MAKAPACYEDSVALKLIPSRSDDALPLDFEFNISQTALEIERSFAYAFWRKKLIMVEPALVSDPPTTTALPDRPNTWQEVDAPWW